ncbi:hypothetical protein BH11ARM1_BH11ARM1_14710 [soil metagenome]
MEILLRSLTQYSGEILLLLCLFSAGTAIILYRFVRKQSLLNRGIQLALEGSSGENLEEILERHLHERAQLQREVKILAARSTELENQLRTSKRHLGMVRYDAFVEVGGNQSFAMALFDDEGNGAILNGVVGRADARIYCKPLVNGRSERTLSQEEQRAIKEAKDGGPKSLLSS